MTPLLRPQMPRRLRWLMSAFGVATLGWTVYCIYAWATHSGIWRLTWDTISAHQRGRPGSWSVAFISWSFGLGGMLIVAWPTSKLLGRRRAR